MVVRRQGRSERRARLSDAWEFSGLTSYSDFTGDVSRCWLLNDKGQILSGQATTYGSRVILYSCNGGSNEVWNRR